MSGPALETITPASIAARLDTPDAFRAWVERASRLPHSRLGKRHPDVNPVAAWLSSGRAKARITDELTVTVFGPDRYRDWVTETFPVPDWVRRYMDAIGASGPPGSVIKAGVARRLLDQCLAERTFWCPTCAQEIEPAEVHATWRRGKYTGGATFVPNLNPELWSDRKVTLTFKHRLGSDRHFVERREVPK